jgi:beta-N-acetylhexosaminidase
MPGEKALKEAGSLLMVGWEGTDLGEPLGILEEIRPSGLIFFRRNYPQGGGPELARQLSEIRAAAGKMGLAPLLLAMDNEGGLVKRLPEPFVQLPKANESGSLDEIEAQARASGAELRELGFNLNLAPVLDVDASGAFMRERSFGRAPESVVPRARAFARGFHGAGIATCAKHFPGLGAAALDPHRSLPTVGASVEEMASVHLAPFRALLGRTIPMVMTTHCLYPALDDREPATFSKKIVDLAREDLGFDGPVLTDDLEMGAVGPEIGEAAVKSIWAGHDLALVCREMENIRAAARKLAEALSSGLIDDRRVKLSRRRVEAALSGPQGGR